jgi:hypothetical protein
MIANVFFIIIGIKQGNPPDVYHLPQVSGQEQQPPQYNLTSVEALRRTGGTTFC